MPEEEVQQTQQASVITAITHTLADGNSQKPEYLTEGEYLEQLLTDICCNLALIGDLTECKANTEFLLSVVGSYLIAGKQGGLEEGALPPAVLFDENFFPALAESELTVEEYNPDDTE